MASITGWITMNGRHVPLIDGESKASAVKRAVENSNSKTTSSKKQFKKEKGVFKTIDEGKEYFKNELDKIDAKIKKFRRKA